MSVGTFRTGPSSLYSLNLDTLLFNFSLHISKIDHVYKKTGKRAMIFMLTHHKLSAGILDGWFLEATYF